MQITLYISGNMCRNMPFKIYTENKYMGTLSLAIVSSSISIAIGDGTETRSNKLSRPFIFVSVYLCVHPCTVYIPPSLDVVTSALLYLYVEPWHDPI